MMNMSLMDAAQAPGATLMAGAYDALSARLAERAGFPAVYLSGSATAASAFGKPDLGLVTMAEMAEQCRRMAAATTIPIMADGDTGYGDQNAVRRTVEAYEVAGVGGITLEDQTWPKRCGYMDGLSVVDDDEIGIRIEAAVASRKSSEFVIVGRTDSLAPTNLETAIERGRTIVSAGADILWIVGLQQLSTEELTKVRRAFTVPLLVDHTELPHSVKRTADDYAEVGFDVVLFPLTSVLVTVDALSRSFSTLVAERSWEPIRGALADFEDYNQIAGLDDEITFNARFLRGDAK